MSGEKNLSTLIASMQPHLHAKEYVFCCVSYNDIDALDAMSAVASFREEEGLTVILERQQADLKGFDYDGSFSCITLNVHSSLEAVGLTASVSTALADEGISANVVAAFYHDHIFVPREDEKRALRCLEFLSTSFA